MNPRELLECSGSTGSTPTAALIAGQGRVLEMVATGAPLTETLTALVRLIEFHSPDVLGSILLLDAEGTHLRHSAAPSLPAGFCRAIDGASIGPQAGSCGTAAYRRESVVVADIASDPLWQDYKDLAEVHGLRACWSTPILDDRRDVLGTFAMYFRTPGRPSRRHLRVIELVTHTAAIAIAKAKEERERLRLTHELGERIKELTVLQETARLLQNRRSIDQELFTALAAALPQGWQFPDICAARIAYAQFEASTPGWRASPWLQSARFGTGDGLSGTVEIAYVEERPVAADGPFLAEERKLIQSVADLLATHLERIRVQTSLRASEAMFRSVFENAAIGMTLTDAEGRIVRCNAAFTHMLGYSEGELEGRAFSEITHPEDVEPNLTLYRDLMAGRIDQFQLNKRYLHKTGTVVWAQLTVSVAPTQDAGPRFTIGMAEDITARKQAEARIEYLATHDGLTGLPNRTLMHDRITQAISHDRRTGRYLALMYIDLDRFKVINDGFGHPFGDAVLKAAGERLASIIRDGDAVARQSGDEYLVLLANLYKSADVYIVTQKVMDAFEPPFSIEGREVFVTTSIGVSVYPQNGTTADALIHNADVAMYRAKTLGRNTYQFFTAEMGDGLRQRVELETQLRLALLRNELHLAYQPKVDLTTGAITGVEALLRWTHPQLGTVSPARFIPLAEETGLIVPIGDWVLRTACAQGKAWKDTGLPPVSMSVNISARQFQQQDVVAWVLKTLAETGLPPQMLELELTESLLAQDTEKVVDTVTHLKAAGIQLSIDDFGTGYSSLSYIKRFRVDTLKIDQSFIRHMLTDADDAAIALAVISLAHSLRMKAIAEGVETAEHCEFLRRHGCDQIQGYYFSKPLPAAEIAAMLAAGKRLDRGTGTDQSWPLA